MTTLIDLQARYGTEIDQAVVNDLRLVAPEITRIPSVAIQGTAYKYRKAETAPRVGYRPANAGIRMSETKASLALAECFLLHAMIGVDRAMAEGYPGGWEAILAEEVENHMKGIMFSMGLQFWYGQRADQHGFKGLFESMGDYMTLHSDPGKNEDSKANRADQHGASAVFVVEDPAYIRMIYGMEAGIRFTPVRDADLTANDVNGLPATLPCKVQDVSSWQGLSVRSSFAAARLKCITAENPVTDDKLSELRAMFPAAVRPTALYMNPYAGRLLQQQRTAKLQFVNGASAETAAAWPTEFQGVPIVYTDALLDDESDASLAKLRGISSFATPHVATLKN